LYRVVVEMTCEAGKNCRPYRTCSPRRKSWNLSLH